LTGPSAREPRALSNNSFHIPRVSARNSISSVTGSTNFTDDFLSLGRITFDDVLRKQVGREKGATKRAGGSRQNQAEFHEYSGFT